MEMVARVALVGLGGALGAVARHLLGLWIATRVSPDFPWSTFLINISGLFLIGVFLGLASAGQLSNEARLFLAAGVLGRYTTFSTFSYESFELLVDGSMRAFLLNTLGQLSCGLIALYFGLVISRLLGGAQ
jgi:CrcB protein